MICSFLLAKATYLYKPCLTFLQHLTKLIIQSIVHRIHTDFGFTDVVLQWFSSYLNDRIHYVSQSNLLLLLYTQVFLRVQFLALCFSQCILSLCLPLFIHTQSYIIYLLMIYKYRCLLPQIEHLSYFNLCSHAYVMSKHGKLRTCLNLMTKRQK